MNDESNKEQAKVLTEKELEGVSGGSSGSEEFFHKLFDVENHGKPEWGPYVDVDIGSLVGSGAWKGNGAAPA